MDAAYTYVCLDALHAYVHNRERNTTLKFIRFVAGNSIIYQNEIPTIKEYDEKNES